MRKGLLALVVVLALLALALLLWPREIEQGTTTPAGNAAVVVPSDSLADARTEAGGAAPDPTKPPAAEGSRQAPTRAESVELAPAPEAIAAVPPPEPPVPEDAPAGSSAAEETTERMAALTPADEEVEPEGSAPSPAAAAESADDGAAEDAPDEAPDAADADEGAPVLDLVRVAPDGQAVVAGRAAPGETVEILLDDAVVGSADAGADGGFVAVLETGAAAEPREMRLRVPQKTAAHAPEAPAPARGAAPPSDPARGSGYATSAPFVILPGAGPAQAPVVVARGPEDVDVVQPAEIGDADRMALDRLTYETGGDLIAAGRGSDSRAVRTYADGRLVAEARVGPDGDWQAVIPQGVAEGTALLRFDEVDRSGRVVSRLEAPFDYSEDGRGHEVRQREITIQRGNNLWRLAEQHYGEGLRYSVIFDANADLIRNPDLIYPGQVFTVPELVEAE